jgi:hypothetical protein
MSRHVLSSDLNDNATFCANRSPFSKDIVAEGIVTEGYLSTRISPRILSRRIFVAKDIVVKDIVIKDIVTKKVYYRIVVKENSNREILYYKRLKLYNLN